MTKYKLTNNTKQYNGVTLRQIQALKDFGDVEAGDLGGWIEGENNLSQENNAWVYGNAMVFGNAHIYGNAEIYGNAKVCGNARVAGNSRLCDKKAYIQGYFIGGDDTSKITNITHQTGTNYWKAQYVLGDYQILDLEQATKKSITLELTESQLEKIKKILND